MTYIRKPERQPEEIIRAKSLIDENGCWLWQGTINHERGGYPYVGFRKKTQIAHRLSYRTFKGEIPQGFQIDHLCRVRHCVNPDHLEAVSPRENNARSLSISNLNSRKTKCKHGHDFTEENTQLGPRGRRNCRTCQRDKWNALYAQNREAMSKPRIARGHVIQELTKENASLKSRLALAESWLKAHDTYYRELNAALKDKRRDDEATDNELHDLGHEIEFAREAFRKAMEEMG